MEKNQFISILRFFHDLLKSPFYFIHKPFTLWTGILVSIGTSGTKAQFINKDAAPDLQQPFDVCMKHPQGANIENRWIFVAFFRHEFYNVSLH